LKRYGVTSMAHGIWIYKSFACIFFSFLGHWKGIKSQACIMSIMLQFYL
jgi:hypothetical protein